MFPGREDLDYDNPNLSDALKYKWVEFHKWKFIYEYYVPIYKNLIFHAKADLSFLGLYNPAIGYSPFERVELGGDGLSNLNEATQLGRDIVTLRGYPIVTPTGGSPIYNKYTIELRYPFSLNQSAVIYAILFVEAGNFWNSIQDYNPFQLARSAGAGVRVFLPMFGLLGFDYGFGWDRQSVFGIVPTGNNIFSKYGQFNIILGREAE
jgi:outer membrane protein insertion porin family